MSHSSDNSERGSFGGDQLKGAFPSFGLREREVALAALAPVSPSMVSLELSGLGLPLFQAEVR